MKKFQKMIIINEQKVVSNICDKNKTLLFFLEIKMLKTVINQYNVQTVY